METAFDDLLGRWGADAATRRDRWPDDPIATTLDLCAAEIREVLAGMSAVPMSPAEYALREGVTEQAVTGWCRRGELEAYRDERAAVDAGKALKLSRDELTKLGGWSDPQMADRVYADVDALEAATGAARARLAIRGDNSTGGGE